MASMHLKQIRTMHDAILKIGNIEEMLLLLSELISVAMHEYASAWWHLVEDQSS